MTVGHSIQDAIDRASPGDTITIGPGTFTESIVVWQDGLTIVGHNTVIRPKPGGRPFGVCVSYSPGCLSFFGSVSHDTVSGITVENVAGDGFLVLQADYVTLSDDRAFGNVNSGFAIERTATVTLVRDTATGNHGFGFWASGVSSMRLTDSVARTNCAGVALEGSSSSTVAQSIFTANAGRCPELTGVPSINGSGAFVDQSDHITFTHNVSSDNGAAGRGVGLNVSQSPAAAANLVEANSFSHNLPVDIRTDDLDPSVNSFAANACTKSDPVGLC